MDKLEGLLVLLIFSLITCLTITDNLYAICPYSVVAVRSGASDKSEMVSQLLFGEMVEVLETKGKQWHKIRCINDSYIGWVAYNQLHSITPSEYKNYKENYAYNLELMQPAIGQEHYLPITIGARLPAFDGLRFQLGEQYFSFSGQAVFPKDIQIHADLICKIARRYLYAPFLWGGRSPMGIDGAGLTQMVYQISGIALPREPIAQLDYGEIVDFAEQSLPGDLAFFENRNGRIVHVGIMLSDQQIIHAHGCVRIDQLDHHGLYNIDTKRYTHRLRVIKRLLTPDMLPSPKYKKEDVSDNLQQIELF